MSRALPFAVGALAATALLGFALRTGLAVATGNREADLEYAGWQVDAARWTVIGVALLLGLVASVFAFRRSRRLEGEGVLLGVPLLLGGLLLSGAPAPVLDAVQDWAGHRTDAYRTEVASLAAYRAEERLHPVPVPMHNFPAPPADLAALLPTLADLGPGWYEGQRPSVVGVRDGRGANTSFQKATRIPGGWDFDRLLWVRVHDYASPQEARAKAAFTSAVGADYGTQRVGTVTFSYRRAETGGQSIIANDVVGSRVWTVMLAGGQPDEPLMQPEIDAVLRAVAGRISAAGR